MANSLKKQTQGDAMNIPPGIDMQPVIEYYSRNGRLNMLDMNSASDICLEKFLNFHRSQVKN